LNSSVAVKDYNFNADNKFHQFKIYYDNRYLLSIAVILSCCALKSP